MRVTDGSAYALVGSKSCSDEQPQWHDLEADPDAVELKDGPEPFDGHARELSGGRATGVVELRPGGVPLLTLQTHLPLSNEFTEEFHAMALGWNAAGRWPWRRHG
jgi:F420H(2)-dependent quinone reductase